MRYKGDFGTVRVLGDSVYVYGDRDRLKAWASRPGAVWPCSTLVDYSNVFAAFELATGDLVELETRGIDYRGDCLAAEELSAWADDCLAAAGVSFGRSLVEVSA